jgi:hypothetical protein
MVVSKALHFQLRSYATFTSSFLLVATFVAHLLLLLLYSTFLHFPQVARTAHFNGVQKVVFANGPSAANFFLAEKHRHMPSAGRVQDSMALGMNKQQGGGQDGDDNGSKNSGPQKKAVGMSDDDNPKEELVDELRKVRVRSDNTTREDVHF